MGMINFRQQSCYDREGDLVTNKLANTFNMITILLVAHAGMPLAISTTHALGHGMPPPPSR